MGFMNKVAFWKKEDDSDFGLNDDLNLPPPTGQNSSPSSSPSSSLNSNDNSGLSNDRVVSSSPFGQTEDLSPNPSPTSSNLANSGPGASGDIGFGAPPTQDFEKPGLTLEPSSEETKDPFAPVNLGPSTTAKVLPTEHEKKLFKDPTRKNSSDHSDFSKKHKEISDYRSEKDMELISAKLDALKSAIESMNQRLINIENIARQESNEIKKASW